MFNLGEDSLARGYLEEGMRLAQTLGDRLLVLGALVSLCPLALRQGDNTLALTQAQTALDIATAVQDPSREAIVLCQLGGAELALGRHAPAATAFERAHALALMNHGPIRHDAAAGLARVALARGNVADALASVEGVLGHLADGGTLDGTDMRQQIRLTCHRVLARAGDRRTADLLATAHAELQARAAAITDPALRNSFLENIPEHREIAAAWVAGPGSPEGEA